MDINLPNTNKAAISNGMGFFELFLGVDSYTSVRSGETVKITTADGVVEGKVSAIELGPLGRFFSQGVPHTSSLGRGYDVRALADSLEDRYPAKVKGNDKALDPRTIYTQVVVQVPYVAPVVSAPTA